MTDQTDAVASLAALLRGDPGAAEAIDSLPPEVVRNTAVAEGLAPLVAERLLRTQPQSPVLSAFAAEARHDALQDVLRQRALKLLLEAFQVAAVPALVFKGEQLAHLCYDRPDLRPRIDSDLLVRPSDRTRARVSLEQAGYSPAPQLEADLISYQCAYVKHDPGGGAHVVDLHWRVSNPQEFGGALDVDELFASSIAIPALGSAARGPGLVHALAVSVLHAVAHHRGRDRLLWDFDSALLASRLSEADWSRFAALMTSRGLGALCHARLARAIDLFNAAVPRDVMSALAHSTADVAGPALATGPATQAGAILADLRALPRWSDRAAFARQHLLPPAEYMRRIYAPASRSPLALLYMQRAILGFLKYCRRPH